MSTLLSDLVDGKDLVSINDLAPVGTEVTAVTVKALPVVYRVSDAAIGELRKQFAGLKPDTPEGYEATRKAIAVTRGLRSDVEATRVALKKDSLEWGRRVDAEAKRLTTMLLEIETPLKTAKDAIDNEKERVKREAAEAEQRRLAAEDKARREAEEKRLADERAELEKQRAALRAQQEAAEAAQRAAREKIEQERRRVEDQHRAEREAIEADRRKVQAEKDRLEREERERQEKARAEKEAAERAERERVEAEKEAARLEAMKPDVERIQAFGAIIRQLALPTVADPDAAVFVARVTTDLCCIAERCEQFTGKRS